MGQYSLKKVKVNERYIKEPIDDMSISNEYMDWSNFGMTQNKWETCRNGEWLLRYLFDYLYLNNESYVCLKLMKFILDGISSQLSENFISTAVYHFAKELKTISDLGVNFRSILSLLFRYTVEELMHVLDNTTDVLDAIGVRAIIVARYMLLGEIGMDAIIPTYSALVKMIQLRSPPNLFDSNEIAYVDMLREVIRYQVPYFFNDGVAVLNVPPSDTQLRINNRVVYRTLTPPRVPENIDFSLGLDNQGYIYIKEYNLWGNTRLQK